MIAVKTYLKVQAWRVYLGLAALVSAALALGAGQRWNN
jgi:hypothetical protein